MEEKILHVVMKLKNQETYFKGVTYPHYEIGWKDGETFHMWNGLQCKVEDVEKWVELK